MRTLIVMTMLACITPIAYAQRLPTDAELKSAYCLRVLRNTEQQEAGWEQSLSADVKNLEQGKPADSPNSAGLSIAQMRGVLAVAQQSLATTRSTINRLQLYILPRIQYLDAASLLAATTRADADIRDLNTLATSPLFSQCAGKCFSSDENKTEQCLGTCLGSVNNELRERMRSCNSPTWLPF